MSAGMIKRIAEIIKDEIVGGESSWDAIAVRVLHAMRVPTEKMVIAGWEKSCIDYCSETDIKTEWQAMIDAALTGGVGTKDRRTNKCK